MHTISSHYICVGLLFSLAACAPTGDTAPSDSSSQARDGVRLYVVDGGELESDPTSYDLAEDEVQTSLLSIAAYLIVHPDGILMWDTLGVADTERQPGRVQTVVRLDNQNRYITDAPALGEQLAAAGFEFNDVTHLAFSHYHWDHTANAAEFAHATWLVHPAEHEEMFNAPSGSSRPEVYAALADSPTVLLEDEEHDVFGDGKVVLKKAPGHTPGHMVLYVALENTGGVVLSGDLYHYPEERSLNRLPTWEADPEGTTASRAAVDEFLVRHDADLWIGHDLIAHRALRHAPQHYD